LWRDRSGKIKRPPTFAIDLPGQPALFHSRRPIQIDPFRTAGVAAMPCRRLFPLLLALAAAAPAFAQEPTEKPADVPIGVVDVLHIFKHYAPAAEQVEKLKREVQELEQTVQLRQVELEQLQKKLAAPPQAGEDREKLQLQFARLQTELRLLVERERGSLQRREVGIQLETYKKIQEQVKRIAKERGLKLVMVRPRPSLDSQDLQEVIRALNQPILYEEGLDITDQVLAGLREREKE
jgi:Skp family chaperone for outer membrane proteins